MRSEKKLKEVARQRSELMARIRSVNTKPELAVRSELHKRGLRFRLHRRDLPGNPDLLFPRARVALFVHGCFWHQHEGCRLASKPKTRAHYWTPKLAANVARDQKSCKALSDLGWRTEVIWECQVRSPITLARWADSFCRKVRKLSNPN